VRELGAIVAQHWRERIAAHAETLPCPSAPQCEAAMNALVSAAISSSSSASVSALAAPSSASLSSSSAAAAAPLPALLGVCAGPTIDGDGDASLASSADGAANSDGGYRVPLEHVRGTLSNQHARAACVTCRAVFCAACAHVHFQRHNQHTTDDSSTSFPASSSSSAPSHRMVASAPAPLVDERTFVADLQRVVAAVAAEQQRRRSLDATGFALRHVRALFQARRGGRYRQAIIAPRGVTFS
jgi:hypothetical protein